MKTKPIRLVGGNRPLAALVFAVSGAAFLGTQALLATDTNGTWIVDANGSWSDADTMNWSGGSVADGTGFTADFSTIDITADRTVSLAAPRSIGNLIFGDVTTSSGAGWTVDNAATAGNILTLAGTTPTITVNPLAAVDIYAPKSVVMSGVITGTSGLTKAGSGRLKLTAANTFTGGTVVNGGTLAIINDNNLGAVPGSLDAANITLNSGATLDATATTDVYNASNTVDLGANRGITLGAGTQTIIKNHRGIVLNIRGVISGAGGVDFKEPTTGDDGGGTRTHLYGANTYSGDTTITHAGIKDPGLWLHNSLALQNSTLNYVVTGSDTNLLFFDSGLGSYTFGGLKGSKNLNLSPQGNSAKNLKIGNNNQDTTYTGVISSSNDATAGLTKIGAGILTLTNANTYSGITRVDGGTLRLTSNTGIQNSAFDPAGAGVLDITSTNTPTFGGLTGAASFTLPVNVTALTLNPPSGISVTYTGNLGGGTNPALTKTGAGTQTLSGTNSYPGVTTISAGALVFGKTAALYQGNPGDWTAAKIVVNSGGIFGVGVGGAEGFSNADISGTLLPNLTTGLSNNGLKAGSAIGFDTSNAGGSFTINDALANTTGTGGGALGLAKYGSGTLVLTAVHSFTGNLTIAGGTLSIAGTGQLGSGSYGGTIANSGVFSYNSSAAQTLGGVVSGTGALTHGGSGTLTLSATNTFSGQLTVEAGTLTVSTVNNAGTSGPLGNSSLAVILGKTGGFTGTLDYPGAGASSTKKFTMAGGGSGVFQVDTAGATLSLSATGAVTGTGGLGKTGAGTLDLTGTGNNYTGSTNISLGVLRRSNPNTGDDLATVTIAGSGAKYELNFSGTDTVDKLFIGSTQMPSGVYKAVGSAAAGTELAQLAGTGTLTVTSGVADASYANWASGFSGPPLANTAANADPDNDGLPNAVEYVLGTDPRFGNAGGPVPSISGTDLVLTFKRKQSSATPDVALRVNVSADLTDWTSLPGYTIGTTTATSTAGVEVNPAGPDNTDIITVRIPMSPHVKKFAQLRVTVTP